MSPIQTFFFCSGAQSVTYIYTPSFYVAELSGLYHRLIPAWLSTVWDGEDLERHGWRNKQLDQETL